MPQSTADPFESTSQVLDTSNWKNADDLHDPTMPALDDTDDELEQEGIFSYSNEDPDLTNLEDNLEVSPLSIQHPHLLMLTNLWEKMKMEKILMSNYTGL